MNAEDALTATGQDWEVDPSTIRMVTEGVWYGDRRSTGQLQFGVWWTHNGKHAVSLVHGYWDATNRYEYHVLRFVPCINVDRGSCQHATFELAQACALQMIRTGAACGEGLL